MLGGTYRQSDRFGNWKVYPVPLSSEAGGGALFGFGRDVDGLYGYGSDCPCWDKTEYPLYTALQGGTSV